MSDISLRPLAEVILDQLTAGRREAYVEARKRMFKLKRRITTLTDITLASINDPDLSFDAVVQLKDALGEARSGLWYVSDQLTAYESQDISRLNLPTLDEMLADLEQCQREMAEIRWNLEEQWISGITKNISLQVPNSNHMVDLGPFEIRLFYKPIRNYSDRDRIYSYKVIALEPCYPLTQRGGRGSNPHPHINHTTLCEGEATTVLSRALNDFRLCDFFLLINSTLNCYNPRSPHYRLEKWDRARCRQCGEYIVEEELVQCSYCESKMCSECAIIYTCAICNKLICSHHTGQRKIRKCNKCNQYICLQHYKSIRKHSCFKEIKEERIEVAKERLKLIEEIGTIRARIAEEGITPNSEETTTADLLESSTPYPAPGCDTPSTNVHVRIDNRTNEEVVEEIESATGDRITISPVVMPFIGNAEVTETTGPTGFAD